MTSAETTLRTFSSDVASVIPIVDAEAEHERWDPGLGPFEEERQLEKLLSALADEEPSPAYVEREVGYPTSGKRCDLRVRGIPIEAKLLRFRRDNGNIDPNTYKSVFSPFPERSSSSLLTDARKLVDSGFELPCGLLGLYYEKEDEVFDRLRADRIAEKFALDVEYWYDDVSIETVAIEAFDGLRHQHFRKGAVISWMLR